MTYLLLNAVFLAAVAVLLVVALRRGRLRLPALLGTLAVLLVMTAVFDNIMIGVGLVDYAPDRISGVKLGIAPLEDFAYAVAALVLLPSVWTLLGSRRTPKEARS